MSTNGLGAEGDDASGTIEAGYFVPKEFPDYKKIVTWFEDVWRKATKIEDIDLDKAQEKWDFRNREMPITPSTQTEFDTSPLDIDPSSLLEERINTRNRLRAVKRDVLNRLQRTLPDVKRTELGKIAEWACHLLLNRTGKVLEYSARNGEGSGPATDQWIVGRLRSKTKNGRTAKVETLLAAISRDPFFTADARRAANQVLSASPWIDHDLPRDTAMTGVPALNNRRSNISTNR